MGFEMIQNGDYYNADIKSMNDQESINLTLEYDTPMEKEGMWGKYYIVKANINDTVCSFIVSEKMRSKVFGESLIEHIMRYKKGDTIKITKHIGKTKKGIDFAMFEVTPVDVTEQEQQQKGADDGVRIQMISMLNEIAEEEKEPLSTSFARTTFATTKLKEAGVDDESLRLSVAKEFSDQYNA